MSQPKTEEGFAALLMAEYGYCAEAFRQSEGLGEKRVTTFLAVATLLVTVVGLMAGEKGDLHRLEGAAPLPIVVVLAIGLLTFLRVVKRNLDTDGYKAAMDLVRAYFAERTPGAGRYLFFDFAGPRPVRTVPDWPLGGHGGWLETVAVMNCVLAALATWLEVPEPYRAWAAAAVAVAAWVGQREWARARYRKSGGRGGQYFRAGVGAVILNREGQVLSLERSDTPGSWQLPQGGLEAEEEPKEAALREVEEETGLRRGALELVEAVPELLAYELEPSKRSAKTGRGQVQHWFIYRHTGADADVDPGGGGEFRAWRWTSFDDVLREVVSFRRPVYARLGEFLRQRSGR